MVTILLGFIPGFIIIWLLYKFLRMIVRRIFFKQLVARITRRRDSKAVLAMVAALDENDQNRFRELADAASWEDIRALVDNAEVAEKPGRVPVFNSYAKSHVGDSRGHYLHGVYLVRKAWEARGIGAADTVTQKGWDKFYEHLESAEDALNKAIKISPSLPDAYAEMLVVHRGRGHVSKAKQTFDQARQHCPHDIGIHHMMMQVFSARWMGSDKEVLTFARTHNEADPTGNLACLIPMAHLDVWQSSSDATLATYLKDKTIRKELKTEFKRFLASPKERQADHGRLGGLQYFACLFDHIPDLRNSKKAFRKMKGRYSSAAWRLWNNPEERFVRAKWWAGA